VERRQQVGGSWTPEAGFGVYARVDSKSASCVVDIRPAVESVVPGVAEQTIVAEFAEEPVVTGGSEEVVTAFGAVKDVGAVAARKPIIAGVVAALRQ
jgi:hypothetical protein